MLATDHLCLCWGSSASELLLSLAGFTGIPLLLSWKSCWQFKLFFHTVIALFNFKLLIFFPPAISSAVLMWLMMLGIRTSSEFFSLCDVKTIYIVIPNKFSIWQSPLLALDDFFPVSYCSLINIYLGNCAHFQIQRGRLSLPWERNHF